MELVIKAGAILAMAYNIIEVLDYFIRDLKEQSGILISFEEFAEKVAEHGEEKISSQEFIIFAIAHQGKLAVAANLRVSFLRTMIAHLILFAVFLSATIYFW